MKEEEILRKLGIIANLLARQIIDSKSLNFQESAWILRECGMDNKEISDLLGIPPNVVAAHLSNKRRQLAKGTTIK